MSNPKPMEGEKYYRPIRSNRDRVYRTLERGLGNDIAEYAEHVLAKAGLIAPDLPEPWINITDGWYEWGHMHGNRVMLHYDTVVVEIPDDIYCDLTIGQARELAAWLNAAADYAEKLDKGAK